MSVRIDEHTDHMKYTDDMEAIDSDIMDQVIAEMNAFDPDQYTEADVRAALNADTCSVENFKALLSPAAMPFLEEIARKAQMETRKHFGNSVMIFTPLYIANYCENYCIYCGFNCHNKIKRAKLSAEEIEKEMKTIADSGLEEILILTGESPNMSDVKYIGEACKIARKYFKVVGLRSTRWIPKTTHIFMNAERTLSQSFRKPIIQKIQNASPGRKKKNFPISFQCPGTCHYGRNPRRRFCGASGTG